MKKTTNYQLSQWDAGDKVQRVDFNADNAKIDAGLKANADAVAAEVSARTAAIAALEARSALQTIKTARAETAAQTFTLPLSDVSWSAWREIVVAAQIYVSGGTTSVYQVFAEGASDSSSIGGGTRPMVILLWPARSSGFPFAGIALGNDPKPFNRGASFSAVSGLRFQASGGGTISAGSSVTVYGLK